MRLRLNEDADNHSEKNGRTFGEPNTLLRCQLVAPRRHRGKEEKRHRHVSDTFLRRHRSPFSVCICLPGLPTWHRFGQVPARSLLSSPLLIAYSPCLPSHPMRPWTTLPERTWLAERIPQWHRRTDRKGSGFLEQTVIDFLKTFPEHKIEPLKLHNVSVAPYSLLKRLLTRDRKFNDGTITTATNLAPNPSPLFPPSSLPNLGGR